jgi:hypothetical protein
LPRSKNEWNYIPLPPNTPSWRDAQLKHKENFIIIITTTTIIIIINNIIVPDFVVFFLDLSSLSKFASQFSL